MIRIRPADILFMTLILGAAGGYVAGKNDLLGKIQFKIDAANDRRALRNAQILLDVYHSTELTGVVKSTGMVENAKTAP